MMTKYCSATMGPCIVACVFCSLQVAQAQELEQSPLGTAAQEWQKYIDEMVSSHYRIEGRFRHENRKTGAVFFDNKFQHSMCGEYALTTGDVADSQSRFARGANKEYQFKVRASDSKNWQLKSLFSPLSTESSTGIKISPEDPIVGAGAFASDAHGSVTKALCRGLLLWENWFPSMIRSSGFTVESVDTAQQDDRELVKVQFTYAPSKWEKNIPRDGWVMLDPELRWLIVKAKTKAEWLGGEETGTLEITNQYTKNNEGVPLLTRQEIVIRSPENGKDVDHLYTREYKNYIEIECVPEDYMVSAFGLPEPQSTTGRTASRRLYFIIGNLLVLAAFLFWWFARRRASSRVTVHTPKPL